MQPANLKNFIRQLSKEKDLEIEVISDAIEQAMLTASRKNLSMYHNARAKIDVDSGQLSLLVTQTVVENVRNKRLEIDVKSARKLKKRAKIGDEVEVEIDPRLLGRIAAESAKQVVIQKLRDAEREKIHNEYSNRIGSVVTGVISRFERRDAVLNIGKAEAVLPLTEQPFGARYQIGDRLKCLIVDVQNTHKGPLIKLSRTATDLILRLFEQEVPEVADKTVEIVALARHAGVRTKLAVNSKNPDVDPVGACVGMKGSRVQMIVHEFENEKIDIIPFSANPRQYIQDAMKPAKILSLELNEQTKEAKIIVPEDNLALAIGQKGQNVQLASKLVGWKIDIKGDETFRQVATTAAIQRKYLEDFLNQVEELEDAQRETILASEEFRTVERIATARLIEIDGLLGGNEELAGNLIEAAREFVEALSEMEQAAGQTPVEAQTEAATAAEPATDEAATAETSAPAGDAAEANAAPDAEQAAQAEDATEAAPAAESTVETDGAPDAEQAAQAEDATEAAPAAESTVGTDGAESAARQSEV